MTILRITGVALAAAVAGCSVTPKPYARDPLVKDARKQRGNFEAAQIVPPHRDTEPIPPPSPTVSGQWVNTDW